MTSTLTGFGKNFRMLSTASYLISPPVDLLSYMVIRLECKFNLAIVTIIFADPQDPHAHLYDVDDGKCTYFVPMTQLLMSPAASTIITMTEWYHLPSPASFDAFE